MSSLSLTILLNLPRWIKKLLKPVPDSLPAMVHPLKSVERVSPLTSQTASSNGTLISRVGTQRRTKKVVTTQTVGEDKKLKATVKKFGKFHFILYSQFLTEFFDRSPATFRHR